MGIGDEKLEYILYNYLETYFKRRLKDEPIDMQFEEKEDISRLKKMIIEFINFAKETNEEQAQVFIST